MHFRYTVLLVSIVAGSIVLALPVHLAGNTQGILAAMAVLGVYLAGLAIEFLTVPHQTTGQLDQD